MRLSLFIIRFLVLKAVIKLVLGYMLLPKTHLLRISPKRILFVLIIFHDTIKSV